MEVHAKCCLIEFEPYDIEVQISLRWLFGGGVIAIMTVIEHFH